MRENLTHAAGEACVFLRFLQKMHSGTAIAKGKPNRVDSVDGPSKVRGLFAKITIRNQ